MMAGTDAGLSCKPLTVSRPLFFLFGTTGRTSITRALSVSFNATAIASRVVRLGTRPMVRTVFMTHPHLSRHFPGRFDDFRRRPDSGGGYRLAVRRAVSSLGSPIFGGNRYSGSLLSLSLACGRAPRILAHAEGVQGASADKAVTDLALYPARAVQALGTDGLQDRHGLVPTGFRVLFHAASCN